MASRTLLSPLAKDRLIFLAIFLLLVISVYVHFLAGFAGDKNWELTAAHLWLSGKRLYTDIFEVQPPLIFWLYGLWVQLAQWGGVEDYHVLAGMTLCLVALSVAVSARMLAAHPCFAGNSRRQAQYAMLAVFALVVCASPAYFGDREHLFFTLTLPYMLRFMPSLARARLPLGLRMVTGIMAAVGFCIKPHCLIVFAGIQALTVLRERSGFILASVENAIVYGVGLTYLCLALSWYPDYFAVVMPMAFATYSGYNGGYGRWVFFLFGAFTFALTFIDFRLRDTSPYRRDIVYLVFLCALLLAYTFANNGWGYTYLPLASLLLITTGWVLWEFLYLRQAHAAQGLPTKRFTFGIRDCLLIFALRAAFMLFTSGMALTADCKDNDTCSMREALAQAVADNHAHSFALLDISFSHVAPLSRESDARLATRFYSFWMVPSFMRGDAAFTRSHEWILDYVAQALAQDLAQRRPDLVFVDTSRRSPSGEKWPDLVTFFSGWDNFRAAWKAYEPIQHIDYCPPPEKNATPSVFRKEAATATASCAYDVYRRRPKNQTP